MFLAVASAHNGQLADMSQNPLLVDKLTSDDDLFTRSVPTHMDLNPPSSGKADPTYLILLVRSQRTIIVTSRMVIWRHLLTFPLLSGGP